MNGWDASGYRIRGLCSVAGKIIRWILTVLLLASMALIVSSPSSLAETHPLELDMNVYGEPIREDGWISKNEYQDDSIHFLLQSKSRKAKSSADRTTVRWVTVEIADASQLRTYFSDGSYDSRKQERSNVMTKRTNAVVALNGDFAKYTYDFGYIIRQGVFYRDALDQQKYPRDVLVIDSEGDFSIVPGATSEDMKSFLSGLESSGRTAVNSFTFGPALVIDGEVQTIPKGEHESILATARICICQLDHLKYAVVVVDGGNGVGINLQELANFIPEILPDCKVAYNLDGGGSAHLLINGKMINQTANSRPISDIIYFASAAGD